MTLFPDQPVQAMPVVQPVDTAGDKPDMTKNVLTREWEQHFYNITNQFREDASTLATHTTQIATHTAQIAAIQAQLEKIWPVGSIFISTVDTDPATLIGIGTWAAFGAGKFLVGLDADDASFNPVLKTGGAKTVSVGAHSHTLSAHIHAIDHTHPAGAVLDTTTGAVSSDYTGDSGVPEPDTTSSDGSGSISILPPYIVCYFWQRTA